ncbi:MAG: hypothetical protein ACR2M3_16640, partial [Thermomicrobiales bacterium]
ERRVSSDLLTLRIIPSDIDFVNMKIDFIYIVRFRRAVSVRKRGPRTPGRAIRTGSVGFRLRRFIEVTQFNREKPGGDGFHLPTRPPSATLPPKKTLPHQCVLPSFHERTRAPMPDQQRHPQ